MLNTLKKSPRKPTACRSVMWKSLNAEASDCRYPGVRSLPTAAVPNVSDAAGPYAHPKLCASGRVQAFTVSVSGLPASSVVVIVSGTFTVGPSPNHWLTLRCTTRRRP